MKSDKKEHFLYFSKELYSELSQLKNGVEGMELYEFRYALGNYTPHNNDWQAIKIPKKQEIESLINDIDFYNEITLKPRCNNKITLDNSISELNIALFSGIVNKEYSLDWINSIFYFDIRGFLFIPRTTYFTDEILSHLQHKPYMTFGMKQKKFDSFHGIGYKDFKLANHEIDSSLLNIIKELSSELAFPITIAIAGPTAAGKTEFSEVLQDYFSSINRTFYPIEMDNFFHDRSLRDSMGKNAMSKEGLHFDLLMDCLRSLKSGKSCKIPSYDFTEGISSHDTNHCLKTGSSPLKVSPADIIFIEGNHPFLFDEISALIDIKIVYLTDDPVRLKRKWKRDIDFRKKYNSNYLCNRYFKTQFIKAVTCYRKQLEVCDIAVDTTQSYIYVTERIQNLLAMDGLKEQGHGCDT